MDVNMPINSIPLCFVYNIKLGYCFNVYKLTAPSILFFVYFVFFIYIYLSQLSNFCDLPLLTSKIKLHNASFQKGNSIFGTEMDSHLVTHMLSFLLAC